MGLCKENVHAHNLSKSAFHLFYYICRKPQLVFNEKV